ncbi:MAG: DUF3341 domain-containing protein [Acidobacteriota bacterium]
MSFFRPAVTGPPPETQSPIYGLLAEFGSPQQLMKACQAIRAVGYKWWDAHTPFPVHGALRVMGLKRSPLPWFVLSFGLCGAALGMILQWWVATIEAPLVISGKPLFSWPAFVPIMFECGVLGGALGALLGFLRLSRLPTPYHSLFNSKRFEQMTDDKFFVSIEARDPQFDVEKTQAFLESLGPSQVERVRH